jgi:hypothetical protein
MGINITQVWKEISQLQRRTFLEDLKIFWI